MEARGAGEDVDVLELIQARAQRLQHDPGVIVRVCAAKADDDAAYRSVARRERISQVCECRAQ